MDLTTPPSSKMAEISVPETGVPAIDVKTLPSSLMAEISKGFNPEEAAVESSHATIPELETQPEVSPTESGETPSGQPETASHVEEEVVSGVVYIRLNSQSHLTTEPEISDPHLKVADIVTETPEKVPEIEPVEVMLVEEQPPAKTVKKRKKKTSTGSGIRNRANKTKEVQTIQTIDQKIKGVE